MLHIFGWVPCRFGIFRLGEMLVEDIDAPDRIPGADMPCGSLGLCREPVDGVYIS